MRVAVIIPTYNEAGAIGSVLENLQGVFHRTPSAQWSIVVVDGNSPDGTIDIVRAHAAQHQNTHIIIETEKRGIAAAYITGIRHAVGTLRVDAFVEFDGDGQHDPETIPYLVHRLKEGFDCVIGSRYVSGGTVPHEWEWFRRLLSRFGSLFARLLLEIPVYDVTSGFKVTRVRGPGEVLPRSVDELISKSYAYKIQFLYILVCAGARFSEVPIDFRLRAHDRSKSASRDIVESLWVIAVLRWRTLRQWRLLRVLAIGLVGLVFQAALFEIIGIQLHWLRPSTVILFVGELAVFTNFLLHERFSFKDRRIIATPFSRRLLRFHLLAASSVCIQWLAVRGVEVFVGSSPYYLRIAYICGIGLGFIVNYVGYYFWVWGQVDHTQRGA